MYQSAQRGKSMGLQPYTKKTTGTSGMCGNTGKQIFPEKITTVGYPISIGKYRKNTFEKH